MKTLDSQLWEMDKATLHGLRQHCQLKRLVDDINEDTIAGEELACVLMRYIISLEYRMSLVGFRFADDLRSSVQVFDKDHAELQLGLLVIDNESIMVTVEVRGAHQQTRFGVVLSEHDLNSQSIDFVAAPLLVTDNITDCTRMVVLEAARAGQRIKKMQWQALEVASLMRDKK